MKVGISTSVIQRGRSGVGQYVLALVRAFQRSGTNAQFTLFVLEEDLPLFDFVKGEMEIVPVPESERPAVRNILWHQRRLPDLARRHALDILHVPSYRRLLWPRPCKLVATIHDLAPFRLAGKYDWKRMFYGRVVARRLAGRADRIIAVSHHTAADILQFFKVPSNRISVIHNGIDHDRFSPAPSGGGATLPGKLYSDRPFFLYVARLEHPGKNHVRLVRAFEIFKERTGSNWQLVLGGADWHGAEVIHEAVRRSRCAQDIRTLGFVSDTDLPSLYRAASVFVYPSLFEGFGLPPIEAMACGCPVVCSDRGALGEVIGSAAAVVDPENVESMAEALSRVARDSRLRETMRAEGIAQAAKFSWSVAAEATLRLYSSTCNCTSQAPVPVYQS